VTRRLTPPLGTPFHVGIASLDVETLALALGSVLGLSWVSLSRPDVVHHAPAGPVTPSSQVIWSRQGSPHLELVKAEPGTVYATDRGTYIHHFGYWTQDLTGSIAACQADGWQIEATMLDGDGRPAAFAYLSRPGEAWIELVDRANQPRLAAELGGAH
jgi:hypothetical protein